MSHIEQVNAGLWSAHSSRATEPFAYISQMGETWRVEDVDDGPLGSRRTFDAALALVERHVAQGEIEQAEHNARVLAIIADLDGAAAGIVRFEQITTED
jgi:hypothetical protein